MPPSLLVLFALQIAAAVLLVVLAVQGFRTHVGWGFVPLLILLGPVAFHALHLPGAVFAVLGGLIGLAVFALKHRKRAGILFLLYMACLGTTVALLFTSPPAIAFYVRFNPGFVSVVKSVNPSAYEEAQKLPSVSLPGIPDQQPKAPPTPREVRDLAENETTPSATPPPDPNAAQRSAYVKHARELTALFQQLDAERPKLKPGSPAVAAFNAKAAKYQQGLQALNAEKARLDSLDHANNLNAEAAVALASLQTSARTGDYEAFAATLKKSLADYRQTSAFPQILALARPTLQQTTPDKVLAALQAKSVETARAEFDKTTRQVQGIVNQVPQIVPKLPARAESYHYGYHPGAAKPDFNTENLLATRELWKGEYVNMDEAPGVFYRSADCEFNPQTKYFYTSRNVPKKRLSDTEYKELTRLYHLLGQQEKAIASVTPPTRDAERVSSDLAALKAQLDGYAMK